jgi:hypothetical protein
VLIYKFAECANVEHFVRKVVGQACIIDKYILSIYRLLSIKRILPGKKLLIPMPDGIYPAR